MKNFRTRPHFEDRQIVQYNDESVRLSGMTKIAATVLDFTGTTTAQTAVTIMGVTGYLNSGRDYGLVVEPPLLRVSGTTGYTSVDVTGYVLKSLDSGGTVTWAPVSVSADTNTFVTGGTVTNADLNLGWNTGGSATPIDLTPIGSNGSYLVPLIFNQSIAIPNSGVQPSFGSVTLGSGSTYSSILGGNNNILHGTYSIIGGGYNNYVSGGTANGVFGGLSNIIHDSNGAAIFHGRGCSIYGTSPNSIISGGYNNNIFNASIRAFIGGGQQNDIVTGNHTSIVGGAGNDTRETDYSFIGGGGANYINGGDYHFIGGGKDNQVIGGSYSNIVGGYSNFLTGIYTTIVGGKNNTISGGTIVYSSILGGQNNLLKHNNSHIIGSNLNSISENTTHVDGLNINTVETGTSISFLAISSDGTVIKGSDLYGEVCSFCSSEVSGDTIVCTGATEISTINADTGELGCTSTYSCTQWCAYEANGTLVNTTTDYETANKYKLSGYITKCCDSNSGDGGTNYGPSITGVTTTPGGGPPTVITGLTRPFTVKQVKKIAFLNTHNSDIVNSNQAAISNSTLGRIELSTLSSIDSSFNSEIYGSNLSSILSSENGFITNSSNSTIISSQYSTLNGVTGSTIIGGNNITGTDNDTVYVSKLNIDALGGGTSINNLGIDVNGNVVVGTAGGGGIPEATTATTTTINFTGQTIYYDSVTPGTGNISEDLTGAKLGLIQKIYHNDGTEPTYPAGWVLMGDAIYFTSTLNIIYAEWAGGSRVEYWYVQEQ